MSAEEKARDGVYTAIAEASKEIRDTEGVKNLAEAYAQVRYGPQGWDGTTDYGYSAEVHNRNDNTEQAERHWHEHHHPPEKPNGPTGFRDR